MTSPKIETVYRGGSRYYVHPETGETVPGVTSILGLRAKPFLVTWAAKLAAELAVESIDVLPGMVAKDPQGTIDYLKFASKRFTRKAADTGTAAHGIFERISLGEPIGALTPELAPFAAHFLDFCEKHNPVWEHVEATVWSEKHGYAGSFDAIGVIDGKRVIIDNKTTRSGVHDDVAWQLAAYRYADVILEESGAIVPLPEVEGAIVLHVRPEGWAVHPIDTSPETFAEFLQLREVHRWEKEKTRTLVGRPIWKGAAA